MAIKISSTEVIDNSRVLQNITGANGVCNNFHAAAVAITTVLNFALPVMSLTMSGPVTFTESNKLLGRSALLLLDTSPSAFTPTFSANIKWQNGVTPTWGDYLYWQIALQCIDGTNVRGIALGYEFTGTNNYPAGTFTVRERLITDTDYSVYGQSQDFSNDLYDVEATSDFNFSVVRTATGARIDIQEICDTADYWNLSNASVSFSGTITAWEDTSGATVTDCRIDIDGVAGAWLSLPSTGSLISDNFSVSADVAGASGPGSNSDSLAGHVKIWLRSSQYTDTAVAEFRFDLLAAAANGV
jgi:hypothetical protein